MRVTVRMMLVAALLLALAAGAGPACAAATASSPTAAPMLGPALSLILTPPPKPDVAPPVLATDRVRKARLIDQLAAPPRILILGGSRALRLDPAYLQRLTGLRGFNAAVTAARPEDAWAFVNLLHDRFPAARLHVLWIIHADEFGARPLDPSLTSDPALSRFFPPALSLGGWLTPGRVDGMQSSRVVAPDGMTLADNFSRVNRQPGHDGTIVARRIRAVRRSYARPARLSARSRLYFARTLALITRLDPAPPVIVAAPVDARVYRAGLRCGWGARHRKVLAFLAWLHGRRDFAFLDLSRPASCGCTARDFYDGIHLRPSGARKVMRAALRRFPQALSAPL
jgi:hypothetical protein